MGHIGYVPGGARRSMIADGSATIAHENGKVRAIALTSPARFHSPIIGPPTRIVVETRFAVREKLDILHRARAAAEAAADDAALVWVDVTESHVLLQAADFTRAEEVAWHGLHAARRAGLGSWRRPMSHGMSSPPPGRSWCSYTPT